MKKNGFKTNDIFTRKDLNTDGGELHMFDSCSWLGLSSDRSCSPPGSNPCNPPTRPYRWRLDLIPTLVPTPHAMPPNHPDENISLKELTASLENETVKVGIYEQIDINGYRKSVARCSPCSARSACTTTTTA